MLLATGIAILSGPLAHAGDGSADAAGATARFAPAFQAQLQAVTRGPALDAPIVIDGSLDDPGWKQAARATNFAEVDPGDQVRPPVQSEAWVAYDDRNFYVALIARTIRPRARRSPRAGQHLGRRLLRAHAGHLR